MVNKLIPELGKVYLVEKYTLFHVLDGSGSIEVDFKYYHDWDDKLLFLEKGQYIKFLSDNFVVRQIEFEDEIVFKNKSIRVLFKHLVSLGYINFSSCSDCQKYLSQTIFSDNLSHIIDVSSKQWFWQNPFHANKDEYHLIFDVKDIIDSEYKNNLTSKELVNFLKNEDYQVPTLIKNKIGFSIKNLLINKQVLESQRDLAFTDKTVKEIAYNNGFNDPAYFNRVFKSRTGKPPSVFRENNNFKTYDTFVQNILELLQEFHRQERSLEFYADKMHLSVKTLSKKVRDRMNTSFGQLIRLELIKSAKHFLAQGAQVNEAAFKLGFEEPNHFSAFFKKYSGQTPSEFQLKKVQELDPFLY